MLYPNGSKSRPRVSSPFGSRPNVGAFGFHYGADLIGYSTVRAAGAGTVTFAGWMNNAAGNTILIDLGGGVTEVHMHLASFSVSRGARVTPGSALGVMGSTGNATGACDHFEIRVHGTSVEPLAYVAARLGGAVNQDTKNQQSWLNKARGEKLAVDGIQGAATTAAIKRYQAFLKSSYGYTGAVDGIWGKGTQAAHQKYYDKVNKPKPAPKQPSSGTLRGLRWTGIQRMLKSDFGYRGAIDNIPGAGTISAFQRFMNRKGYGKLAVDGIDGVATLKAAQTWLKSRYEYRGAIDGIRGAGTNAAWGRAEVANAHAYKRIR